MRWPLSLLTFAAASMLLVLVALWKTVNRYTECRVQRGGGVVVCTNEAVGRVR